MWRAFKCGCERDDDLLTEAHVVSSEASELDARGHHHYQPGHTPKTWCNAHKSKRPCECDKPKTKTKAVQTKAKGKKR